MASTRASLMAILTLALPPGLSFAQVTAPASLGFRLTATGQDAGGFAIVQAGDVFSLTTGGVLGVVPNSVMMCAATYQNGALRKAGGLCAAMVKDTSAYFEPGVKVYVTKVDVNLKKEKVSLHLLACDSCNGTNPPSFYKSDVAFQFDKGYLERATPAAVKETIAQVLAPDSGAQQPPQAAPDAPPPAQEPPAALPPPQPPPEPVTINLGQTTAQVLASLGKPEKIVKLATKEIYYYKDMKVTFVDDLVTDVQ